MSSQSASTVAAAVQTNATSGSKLPPYAFVLIGFVLLALIIAAIIYVRSGNSEAIAARRQRAQEKLSAIHELEELEKM